ncbi:MAG: class I SAM-dependent methyltransferase [Rubrivivax sp.]
MLPSIAAHPNLPPAAAVRVGRPRALAWPLPALLTWAVAWALCLGLQPRFGAGAAAAGAFGVGLVAAAAEPRGLRRLCLALGFPLSALVLGGASAWPAWFWALPLLAGLAAYPPRGWRDAPLFPTPAGALDALAAGLPLPVGARVLDAGCGVGDALRALRRAWPHALVEGIELSAPWALVARWRCPWARVRRGDLWASSWSGLQLVYLFQRPESMGRAWAKAQAELAPGAWLVSLEFMVPDHTPDRSVALAGGRSLHAWCIRPTPAPAPAQGGKSRADISVCGRAPRAGLALP